MGRVNISCFSDSEISRLAEIIHEKWDSIAPETALRRERQQGKERGRPSAAPELEEAR